MWLYRTVRQRRHSRLSFWSCNSESLLQSFESLDILIFSFAKDPIIQLHLQDHHSSFLIRQIKLVARGDRLQHISIRMGGSSLLLRRLFL
jgi:hypothetical protein